jgi:tetratricopeptide (TPR) repeat protein
MSQAQADLIQDLPADSGAEYHALVRALKRRRGFGLLFVRCSPAEGKRLIARVRQDLPQKTIDVLSLDKPIDNLYEIIDSLPNKDQLNILFITGIEKSLVDYIKPGIGGQGDYYKLDTIPRILGHLNLQRECFRDNFNICFVFLLPKFALKYFIRRAPDFFDWRSGVLEFAASPESVQQESSLIVLEGDYEKYLSLTSQQRNQKIFEIQELLAEDHLTLERKAKLLLEQGNLFLASNEYEEAIASYDQAINITPNDAYAWWSRGNALLDLGQYAEAVTSYDRTLEIKPDYHEAWYNRGIALSQLGDYEEAIASYDRALAIKPDKYQTWNSRGIALRQLGRYEESIDSYDHALDIKPVDYEAWYNRGCVLCRLGHYEEAIASWSQALAIKPDYPSAFYNTACLYALLGNANLAIENLQQAINLNSNKYREMAKNDSDFDRIRGEQRFQVLLNN